MHIHHLNCISTCPLGGALMDGHSAALRGRLTNHCLLIELNDQLVLVDTGFGLQDIAHPRTRLSKFFLGLLSPEFREEMTAIRQIEALGFDPLDVRHIVLTHLDFDHAGGLDDFPHAQVHLLAEEKSAALAQKTFLDRMRYRPQQWSTAPRWKTYASFHSSPHSSHPPSGRGENWSGFELVQSLEGLPPEILMVPLRGHTLGHAGIAVNTSGDRWLLQTGDAYFYHGEMDLQHKHCTPGLRFYQWMMEKDRKSRLQNQRRLRELKSIAGDRIQIICSHDAHEFKQVAGRPFDVPISPLDDLLRTGT